MSWSESGSRSRLSIRMIGTCLLAVTAAGVAAFVSWRSANMGAVQRGADLTVSQGCLSCHGGPGASTLVPRRFEEFDDADPATLREWIVDGMPRSVRLDRESRASLDSAAIRMPAWRDRLSAEDVDDLVAYLRAVSSADLPRDPAARLGYTVAEEHGCFRCHGPGGRGASRNPGSLKGYIPPWDGEDFPELVANDVELRQWILDGRAQRLQANPLARFFLDRQAIRMPAFRGQVTDDELKALEAYIRGLRSKAGLQAANEP